MASLENKVFLWKQRIGYGVSDFACNLIWQMISLYLLYFYTDIMNLSPLAIGTMFLITRFIDGITDLLVGYWIDKTNTRWGKSRPFFLFGAVPFALFAVLAFSVPNISNTGKLIYAYITYIGLSFAYTIVNIPMASILPSLTSDPQERTALSTSRKFFAFLGATIVGATSLKLIQFFGKENEALGFRIVMIIFGLIGCIMFFVTFANVREKTYKKESQASLKETIISLSKNKPWIVFAINILFMWTGFFIQSSAIVYYYKIVIGDLQLSITVTTMMSVVPMLSNFCVPFLAKKFGKRNLFCYSTFVQILGLLVILFAGLNHIMILLGVFLASLGAGLKESIYFSMQADPVDYGEWKTGINTSGSLSAINGFLGKIAQAVSGWLASMLLAWAAYDSQAVTQTAETIFAVKTMYLYIPIILFIFSIITMMFYNLDKMLPEIKSKLYKDED